MKNIIKCSIIPSLNEQQPKGKQLKITLHLIQNITLNILTIK